MTEREIDTAIDRAVRDLMDVDTDPAFRARVTARLQRPVRRTWMPRLAVGALATAAMVAALFWLRTPPRETRTEGTAATAERATAPQTPPVVDPIRKATVPAPMARPATLPPRAPEPSIPRGTVVAAVAEMPFTSIAPLTAIEPISVDPIVNTPIAPPEIVVPPLPPIAEVEIPPLEPRTARD